MNESVSFDRPAPLDVVALASQVRTCAMVEQALALARWLDGGPRPVTAGKVLHPADIAAAVAAMGVAVPGKTRSASMLPALHRPWCVAIAADLLVIGKGRAAAGPGLAGWDMADEVAVLAGWLGGLRAVCRAESGKQHQHTIAILVLAVLEVLSAGGPSDLRGLRKPVREWINADDVFFDGCDEMVIRRHLGFSVKEDSLGDLLAMLRSFGAVTADPGDVRITTLGRWAVPQLRAGMPHSASPDLSAAEVINLLVAYGGGLADQESKLAGPWLEARTEETAARELLAAAAGMPASARVAAVEVVEMLDEPALPVWRELAGHETIGPHARAVLATWDETDPATAVRPEDMGWLAVEAAAVALSDAGPDEALTLVSEGMPGSEVDAWIGAVGASGHPEAEAVARALTSFADSGRTRTIDLVCQLKVTLLNADRPIWRRVRVAATASLGELHAVVQILFGWEGDHLHVFTAEGVHYSDPFMSLEQTRSEFGVRVATALPTPKRKILYRYDLGAGWRHEIELEEVVDRADGFDLPVCVGFEGDNPVEYPDEDEADEPVPFDLDAVNRRFVAAAVEE